MTGVASQSGLEALAGVRAVQRQQALLDRDRNQPGELCGTLAGRQFDEHARDRAHAKLAAHPDVVAMRLRLRPVDGETVALSPAGTGNRHLDVVNVDDPEAPHRGGGPMAEKGMAIEAQ